MKVLYANPIFLDYRLPFYKELNHLFNGDFYIMFSRWRYQGRRDDLLKRILDEMGKNAVPFNGDRVWDTKTKRLEKYPTGKRIPLVWGLICKLISEKPDLVITEGFFQWTPLVAIYCFLFRKPMIIGYERTLHTERNISSFVTWTRKITDRFTSGYLVNGNETIKYLLSIGVAREKIYVGGMSADSKGLITSIRKMSAEDKQIIKSKFQKRDGLIFLVCGRIEEAKGTPYLLKAWSEHIKKYPNDTIVLIGKGDMLDELKNTYKNEPSIHLEGAVKYQEIHQYYAISDIFILPTLQDNWSLVVPEAMSCGLPVATSIYNGCYSELIKENINGFVFDTLNKESIVSVLEKFHFVNLQEFGKASIELEVPFNTDNCAKRSYEAINKIWSTYHDKPSPSNT